MLAYLLSSTRQHFAVFRLSVNKETSRADKTCTLHKSSHKWHYHSNIGRENNQRGECREKRGEEREGTKKERGGKGGKRENEGNGAMVVGG